jgi:hypothetical protein
LSRVAPTTRGDKASGGGRPARIDNQKRSETPILVKVGYDILDFTYLKRAQSRSSMCRPPAR